MSGEIKHSPLPWVVGAMESGQTGVDSADGSQIFTWASHDNADIILRAVNSHYELLDALEYAVSEYGNKGGPWNVPGDPGGWLCKARSALEKARGEQ
jgi:hypothetical protein